MNGTAGKRKSRGSTGNSKSYKEASDDDEDDDVPLVSFDLLNFSVESLLTIIRARSAE